MKQVDSKDLKTRGILTSRSSSCTGKVETPKKSCCVSQHGFQKSFLGFLSAGQAARAKTQRTAKLDAVLVINLSGCQIAKEITGK